MCSGHGGTQDTPGHAEHLPQAGLVLLEAGGRFQGHLSIAQVVADPDSWSLLQAAGAHPAASMGQLAPALRASTGCSFPVSCGS